MQFKVGDKVLYVIPSGSDHGIVTDIDNSNYPYQITWADGSNDWCKEEELKKAE